MTDRSSGKGLSGPRNPAWTRDENIIALDFYLRHHPDLPSKSSPEIKELSQFLVTMGKALGRAKLSTYRNPTGVHITLSGFRQLDGNFVSEGTFGAPSEDREEVWDLFAHRPEQLHRMAENIRALANQQEPFLREIPSFESEAEEGQVLTRTHGYRERSRKLVTEKKEEFQDTHGGSLFCEVCTFDFKQRYGKRGDGFIECHHTKPVSLLQQGEKTKLSDLALVCSNCHRMIHRKAPWLTLDDLRERLRPLLGNT